MDKTESETEAGDLRFGLALGLQASNRTMIKAGISGQEEKIFS